MVNLTLIHLFMITKKLILCPILLITKIKLILAAFEIVAKYYFIIQTTSLESGHWALHWGTRWQLWGRSARLEHFSTETLFHPCWEQKTIMWSHTHNAQFLHHLSFHLYFLLTIGQQSVGGKHDLPGSTDRICILAGAYVGTERSLH